MIILSDSGVAPTGKQVAVRVTVSAVGVGVATTVITKNPALGLMYGVITGIGVGIVNMKDSVDPLKNVDEVIEPTPNK